MKKIYFIRYVVGALLLILSHYVFADTVKIIGTKIIDHSISYENVLLDLSEGHFDVINNATLEIKNSVINGTISQENSYLFNISQGKLVLNKNSVNVHVDHDIIPNPERIMYSFINLTEGDIDITNNYFDVDKSYSVTLLSGDKLSHRNIIVNHNNINNFHGGLILKNAENVVITDNLFSKVSFSNIYFLNSYHILFENNQILFGGNNNVGDAIDIVNSDDFVIRSNFIASDSCYAIVILGARNGVVESNHIMNGITYGIYIDSNFGKHNILFYLAGFTKKNIEASNRNIVITKNYISQNRFGLTAYNVDSLVVKENIFIQKFSDKNSRKFWTDNNILLKNISNLFWENNLYKEAFSQESDDANVESSHFVIFPSHNGVIL